MWGQKNNTKLQYTSNKTTKNDAIKYANTVLKSEMALVNSSLTLDYDKILKGGCVYLPNYFCTLNDTTIFDKLKEENKMNDMISWSKHSRHEDPTFSETFNDIVKKMAEYFNVEVLQTRLNYYKDGKDWKPFHHDKHAYGKIKEDFTMGASFGASRTLEFIHEESQMKFNFPQNNGDVFAFDSDINKKFMHGVPKVFKPVRERFSIIAWGIKN